MKAVTALTSAALIGLIIGTAWVVTGFDPVFLVGASVGLAAALAFHRLQLAAWTASIRREESDRWLRELPPSLAALRRPLKAVVTRIEAREQALADSVGREQLRDLEIDALRERVDMLEATLDDARGDLLQFLEAAGRAQQADGSAALKDVQILARLGLMAEAPNTTVPLGDVIAGVVQATPGLRGRVVVEHTLPTLQAPRPLVELLVERLITGCAQGERDRVSVGGKVDGGLAVLHLSSTARASSAGISSARASSAGGGGAGELDPVLQRAAQLLGGEAWIGRRGRMIVTVPCRYQPGIRAVSRPAVDWGIPEAI